MTQELNQSISEYLNENPELQGILTIFGETMQTYGDTVMAMGQKTSPQVLTGNTSTVDIRETSLSTANLEFKTA